MELVPPVADGEPEKAYGPGPAAGSLHAAQHQAWLGPTNEHPDLVENCVRSCPQSRTQVTISVLLVYDTSTRPFHPFSQSKPFCLCPGAIW
ncbi:UNVERIFIED_CONTAM: hypothetical protein ACS92_02330 [Bacillus cereus]